MAAAEELGEIKISYNNAAETNPIEAFRVRTNRVSGGAQDPSDFSTLNYRPQLQTNKWVDEGGYIILSFKADAADTIESEESSMMLPIRLMRKADGSMSSRILTTSDLDAFKRSGTDDVVNSTTKFVELGKYTVPTGFVARVDSSQLFHCYLADDT